MFKINVGPACVLVFFAMIFGGIAKGQLSVQSRISVEDSFRVVDDTLEVTFRVANGAGFDELRQWVPESVARLIIEKGLYRNDPREKN